MSVVGLTGLTRAEETIRLKRQAAQRHNPLQGKDLVAQCAVHLVSFAQMPYGLQADCSDLKHITELQAARIQHLEALLASTGMAQPSFSWPGGPAMTPFNGIEGPHLATLPEHQLEVMRPSPESASPLPAPWQTGRADLMAYDPSPHSSTSVNDFRRSSSLSTSESIEGDLKNVGFKLSPGGNTSPIMEEFTSPHPARKLSDVELQMSMSGMDIDAMFGARREWQ